MTYGSEFWEHWRKIRLFCQFILVTFVPGSYHASRKTVLSQHVPDKHCSAKRQNANIPGEGGKCMDSQGRLLLILKYLYDYTDSDHDVSSRDIKRMLESKGISAPDRRTIEADVDAMIASGYGIQASHKQGAPARFKVVERDFDNIELKILIDAVAASQFISAERSKHIINHLAALASISDRQGLLCNTESLLSINNAAERNMHVANDLYQAIINKQKIQYLMLEYFVFPEKIQDRDGHINVVSPYALLWNNDRYYLVAYEEKRDTILTLRVDHIQDVIILDEPIKPVPDDFDIEQYYSTTNKMYSGPTQEVTLICDNSIVREIIDQFGQNFTCVPISERAFKAVVKTSISPAFFGWLFQYAGKITLQGPEEAVKQYSKLKRKTTRGPKES